MKIITNSLIPSVLLGFTLHAAAEPESNQVASPHHDNPATSPLASLMETRAAFNDLKRAVGRQTAANIAKRTIERRTGQSARVTDIGREDDHGARWEVEVTAASGREFDVYVNAAGRVVKIDRKGGDNPATETNRQQAAAIALAHVRDLTGQSARVTDIEREDDHGARWEVEVKTASGREFDVYVDAAGQVVKTDPMDDDTPGPVTDREEAAAIALAHVRDMTGQSARVTGIEREDDFGARWEVEVTRADGFEYDVYVDASGKVVRVKEEGFDD